MRWNVIILYLISFGVVHWANSTFRAGIQWWKCWRSCTCTFAPRFESKLWPGWSIILSIWSSYIWLVLFHRTLHIVKYCSHIISSTTLTAQAGPWLPASCSLAGWPACWAARAARARPAGRRFEIKVCGSKRNTGHGFDLKDDWKYGYTVSIYIYIYGIQAVWDAPSWNLFRYGPLSAGWRWWSLWPTQHWRPGRRTNHYEREGLAFPSGDYLNIKFGRTTEKAILLQNSNGSKPDETRTIDRIYF